ncbi:MAG: hypothetical protein GY862_29600 [Gammaproteobacteria bacterium]|nr:hypothetical protein [Gammaproteobacteria bacterium]
MAVSTASKPFSQTFREKGSPPVSDLEFMEYLDDEDEEDPPLESDWHVAVVFLLTGILRDLWTGQDDIYVSGNTVVRFDPSGKCKFRAPDLYVVKGVKDKGFRSSWNTWEEDGLTPDFILELASESTAQFDVNAKKDIYEKHLKTQEYVVYNPDTEEFKGWRLTNKCYQPIIPDKEGKLWCDEIGLWAGLSEYRFSGDQKPVKTPRFFRKDGQLVLSRDEAAELRADAAELRGDAAKLRTEVHEAEAEAHRAKTEALRVKAEAQRAKAEAQQAGMAERRAEAEAQQAKAEAQRADTAECRAEAEARQAKAEAQRADMAERRAEAEAQQAKAEVKWAKMETQRADRATQQLNRFAARLRELENRKLRNGEKTTASNSGANCS